MYQSLDLYSYLLKEVNDFIAWAETLSLENKNECQHFQSLLMTLCLIVIGGQRKELILDFTIEV